jgi:hypothetical protein
LRRHACESYHRCCQEAEPESTFEANMEFMFGYNAQAAVEVESRLIAGQRVSDAANDKERLVPTVAAVHTDRSNSVFPHS